MKFSFSVFLVFFSVTTYAKEIKNFNKVLIENVQKDINSDNDQAFKTNNAPMRGPASVIEEDKALVNPDVQFEKKHVRQTGHEKW